MNVTVKDSILKIDGLNQEQYGKVYRILRRDLLDCKIAHYRPIAFRSLSNSIVESNVLKLPDFGYSSSELSFIFNKIVTMEQKGVMPSALHGSPTSQIIESDCSFMTIMGKKITSSIPGSMFYDGMGVMDSDARPKLLNKDIVVLDNLNSEVAVSLVLKLGKEMRDFRDNAKLLTNTGYRPVRTMYNLHELFLFKEYVSGDGIQLRYREPLDEEVLEDILEYHINNSKEVVECLELNP